jgi:hypothetical protein
MQFSRRKFMQSAAAAPGLALAAGAAAQEPPRPSIGEPGHFDTFAKKTPVKPHSVDLDSNYIRMPLAPEDAAYGRLEGEHIKGFVREITAIPRKYHERGERWWGRIAGTGCDTETEDLVEAKFRQFDCQDVRRQYFDVPPQWFPISWDVKASGSGKALKLDTIMPAPRSAGSRGRLDLEPVWVGLGYESDFAGRDVKGKLALIYSWPMPGSVANSATYNNAMLRAAERGAAAVLVNVAIPGNFRMAMNGNARGIPTFSIGTDDFNSLRQLMEQGPVKVQLDLATEERPGLRDASVWGELPGTSGEDIIVMAHHDSYFEGALDNASGMAVMLALAEYYSKIPKERRRRTLKFVTTAGHHAGSAGTQWMHDNRDTFLAKTALMINCEHVSVTQAYFDRTKPELRKSTNIDARRWFVNGSDKLASIVLNSYKNFGVTIYDVMDPFTTGDMSHCDHDAPAIQLIESAVFYHTDQDTPEIVPAPGLEAVARAYAKIIDQINKLDREQLI